MHRRGKSDMIEVKKDSEREVRDDEEFLDYVLLDAGRPRWVWSGWRKDGTGTYTLHTPIQQPLYCTYLRSIELPAPDEMVFGDSQSDGFKEPACVDPCCGGSCCR